MSNLSETSTKREVKQIAILLADLGKLNVSVLKYLVLHINTLQQTFEYEFLPSEDGEFLQKLSPQTTVNTDEITDDVRPFLKRYKQFLKDEMVGYDIKDTAIPDDFILITMARFKNKYYSLREGNLSILALGNWKQWMAPPSIIESILTMVVRETVGIVCPPLNSSVHLGTKGCICDFTAYLSEARVKVLGGFVCHYCRAKLEAQGLPKFSDELEYILRREWLGSSNDPKTPAGIASNLGYNLFITKGLTTTPWERIKTVLIEEAPKQLIGIIAALFTAILIAYLLIRFGLSH